MVSDRAFSARNIAVLREAQGALNVAFGAILSAYVGVSLSHMESQPFDHHTLARFFLGVAGLILFLCVGNSVILRGEVRLGIPFLLLGAGACYILLREAQNLSVATAVLCTLSTRH